MIFLHSIKASAKKYRTRRTFINKLLTISRQKFHDKFFGVHDEHIMKHFQPLIAGQRLRPHTEGFEVVENVGFNAFELWLCRAEGVCLNAEGDVLLFRRCT